MTRRIVLPWFEPEAWDRLMAVAGGNISYDEFLAKTHRQVRECEADGLTVDMKTIDVDHLVAWHEAHGDSDGTTNAQDMFLSMQRLHGDLFYVREDPPRHLRTPRHAALFERHMGIMRAQQERWSACWEGGDLVRELDFDGHRFEHLHHLAVDAHDDDDRLDLCERLLDEMEALMAGRPGPFTAMLDFVDGVVRQIPADIHGRHTVIEEIIGEMMCAPYDRPVVDRCADNIRHRVLRELRWQRETYENMGGDDHTQEIADIQRELDAFAEAYVQLRQALPS